MIKESRIRVLIVDDQRMFAESIKYIIESRASDIEIVGVADNGQEAVRLTAETKPHIIIMDVRMPVMNGVQATKIIKGRHPEIKIIILSTFDDDEYIQDSIKFGAVGYLLKNRTPIELINAIRAVRGGLMSIDPAVASALIKEAQTEVPDDRMMTGLNSLTHRELEVLELMINATDNKQMALTLNVGEQTVRNYVSTIYDKLGVVHRMDILKLVDKISWFLERRQSQ